jgi:hypothetical protein
VAKANFGLIVKNLAIGFGIVVITAVQIEAKRAGPNPEYAEFFERYETPFLILTVAVAILLLGLILWGLSSNQDSGRTGGWRD